MNGYTIEIVKNVLLVVFIIIFVGLVFYKNRQKYFKQVLFSLVEKAEQLYGAGKGPEKYKYVVSIFYERLPLWFRAFISMDQIDEWIDSFVKYLENVAKEKGLLENGTKKDLVDAVVNSTSNISNEVKKDIDK